MNRTIRAILGAVFVLVIVFSAISVCQNIGKPLKMDITDQKLYTLSAGTRAILAKLNQPITAKLYYGKTAALKGPDQIRFFGNYYEFVKALLEEYVSASHGMIKLQIIDPRPYSDEEEQALKYGLRRFPITQEENFFFGLVVQTPFGVEKAIPFFSPDRQNFVEYDISSLIDAAVTRQRKTVGILSSLPVMGDDVSGYMAEMMMRQGQQPRPAWTFVEQLKKKYEVKSVPTDVNDVNDMNDIDILLVIHPKNLPEKTLFAIDQFVLRGGRTIVCVDPYCFADRPPGQSMQMAMQQSHSSDLNKLLRTWGLEMPANTFAGDRSLAAMATIRANQRPEQIIGYLDLTPEANCFDPDNVITAQLNQVRFLFSGVLKEVADPNKAKDGGAKIERTPLVMTSNRGNSFKVDNSYELMILDAASLMRKFTDGTKPVVMGYLVTGHLKSSFPDGIEVKVAADKNDSSKKPEDPNKVKTVTKQLTGLKEAKQDCAVVVFSDVDFISDSMAYQNSFFGKVIVGDNSALMLNTVDDLSGSSDLVSIRSRGNFKRPFVVVDAIEKQAEAETAAEVEKINLQIAGFQNELQSVVSSAKKGQEEVIGSSIVKKKQDLELKIRDAQRQLREVKMKRRERIERLGNELRQADMLGAPAVILLIAVVLGLRRSVRKRQYISHVSDA
jgi:gliding motility-associatede transport system auxiliary component